MRKTRFRIMFPVFFLAAAALFSWIVMLLWNAILPGVTGVKSITFIQALGLLVLSKILFGGFGRGSWRGGRGHYQWSKMESKWQDMSPEEREKFKSDWKDRCWKRNKDEEITTSDSPST